jgi:indole-3-glycerol phosphate synthase
METILSGTILDRIMEVKRAEVAAARERLPLEKAQVAARKATAPRDFLGSLRTDRRMHLIAEVKKASPSKGVFRADFDPERCVQEYEATAASALSILTDESFFLGSAATLQSAKTLTRKPCLRKDFIFDEYQIWEARSWGADAVLLIVAVLPPRRLRRLMGLAQGLGMAALVEVHSETEAAVAMDAGAALIGINNRDLRTFEVNLDTTFRLRERLPAEATLVSESGIESREEVRRLEAAQIDAILVGETLIRAESIPRKVAELLND